MLTVIKKETMFYTAMTTDDTLTLNGDVTNSTSGDSVLDFFFKLGAMRGWDDNEVIFQFSNAFAEDPLNALRALFYARDIRGGQGERRVFRLILRWLAENYPDVVSANLTLVPEYGRWDDLFVLFGTSLNDQVLGLLYENLKDGNGLVAKWLPRESGTNKKLARYLAKCWGMSPKVYRKIISYRTQVVENQMCNNDWDIEYKSVPSKAMLTYRKAFSRHDPVGFETFLDKVDSGETTINAGTLYPSDIVGKILTGSNERVLDTQWSALPNWVGEGDFICVSDVSGSMAGQPMNVSIGLGLYLSERANNAFKDLVITFSSNPEFHKVKGDGIRERVRNLSRANWNMSTDLRKVFGIILERGLKFGLDQSQMPKNVLIISDMQFNSACGYSSFDDINAMYENSGYTRPNLVFWNVDAKTKATPVKHDTNGTALISGFSPSIMQFLFGGDLDPTSIMLNVLESDRYSPVSL